MTIPEDVEYRLTALNDIVGWLLEEIGAITPEGEIDHNVLLSIYNTNTVHHILDNYEHKKDSE